MLLLSDKLSWPSFDYTLNTYMSYTKKEKSELHDMSEVQYVAYVVGWRNMGHVSRCTFCTSVWLLQVVKHSLR